MDSTYHLKCFVHNCLQRIQKCHWISAVKIQYAEHQVLLTAFYIQLDTFQQIPRAKSTRYPSIMWTNEAEKEGAKNHWRSPSVSPKTTSTAAVFWAWLHGLSHKFSECLERQHNGSRSNRAWRANTASIQLKGLTNGAKLEHRIYGSIRHHIEILSSLHRTANRKHKTKFITKGSSESPNL